MEIRHYKFNRITLDPAKCFGKPCIRGLRMPVVSVLNYLSSGMTVDDILKEWPELEKEDIYQALGYGRKGHTSGSSDYQMKFLLNMNESTRECPAIYTIIHHVSTQTQFQNQQRHGLNTTGSPY